MDISEIKKLFYGGVNMKIEFKNGSKIESFHTNNSIRGKRAELYNFNLKWWQKIYLKIYYYWIHWIFKYTWYRR